MFFSGKSMEMGIRGIQASSATKGAIPVTVCTALLYANSNNGKWEAQTAWFLRTNFLIICSNVLFARSVAPFVWG